MLPEPRLPEVNVEDGHGDEHGQRDQDHGKQQVFAQQRDGERSGRYDLDQQQEEHGEREQYRYAQRHLLSGLGRQVEHQHGQERYAHAWYDQVHRVEQRLSPERDVEEYVQVRFFAAHVEFFVPHGRHAHDVPLHRQVVVLQVDAHFDHVRVGRLGDVPQVHLCAGRFGGNGSEQTKYEK